MERKREMIPEIKNILYAHGSQEGLILVFGRKRGLKELSL
jgi:hypothetical protein